MRWTSSLEEPATYRLTLRKLYSSGGAFPIFKYALYNEYYDGATRANYPIIFSPQVGLNKTYTGFGTATPSEYIDVAGNINISTGSGYKVNGTQVLTDQQGAIADASGGAVIDAEARTALNSLLAACRTHGIIDT